MGYSQAWQAAKKEQRERSNQRSQRAEWRRAELERVSLFPYGLYCSFSNVSLCYVATFDEREKGKTSAKADLFWSDQMHA